MLRAGLAATLVALASGLPTAAAQTSDAFRGELVAAADGKLTDPWVEKKYCPQAASGCVMIIVNPATNEIAKLGEQVNSHFELTGNNQEIRRAEGAAAKATRLQRRE